jgi:S1-C subfamily serine protease
VCVSDTGVFVTNRHVVQNLGDTAKVKLVLGDDARTTMTVTVLREDADADLAVLRATGPAAARKFTFLELGDDAGLFETMPVTAFGYPFGRSLAIGGQGYPDISVNVGRITSLRKKDGKLHQIQLDAAVNPGNSGGPVIDDTGKLVGIVQSGVVASGVNFAVPVSRLRGLLERPDVVVKPPQVTAAKQAEEAEFRIDVTPLLRPIDGAVVELEVNTTGRPARKFAAAADGGNRYRVKAIPVPRSGEPTGPRAKATLTFPEGTLVGQVDDTTLRINGAAARLVDLKAIDLGAQPAVIRTDGTTAPGRPEGLDTLRVDLGGGFVVDVPLDKLTRVELQPVQRSDPQVTYAVVVRRGTDVLARVDGVLDIAGATGGTGAALATPGSKVAFTAYKGAKSTIEVPDTIADALLAGGGRYLLLHLPKTRKIAVYDVNQGKVARYLSLGSDKVLLAAGATKLIVVAPAQGVIERWSLETFQRETARPLPVNGVVKAVAMGYASNGPLLIHWAASTDALARAGYTFFDTERFEDLKIANVRANNGSYRDFVHIRASGTGDVFGMWATSHSPQGMETLALIGKEAKSHYQHNSAGHIVPNYDGSAILTGYAGLCGPELNRKTGGEGRKTVPLVPSTHPRFYVGVPAEPGAQINLGGAPFEGVKPTLHTLGVEGRLVDLPDLQLGRANDNYSWSANDFTLDKRVVFVAQADQLITIPYSNDRLIVQRFNMREAMEKAGIDYFYVTSIPPTTFTPGQTVRYAVQVAAKRGTPTFELSSAPEGMTLTPAGIIEWPVPATFGEDAVSVIVTVKGADGQVLYDSFKMTARK